MSDDKRYPCPVCGRQFGVTACGQLRIHGPRHMRCPGSDEYVLYKPLERAEEASDDER